MKSTAGCIDFLIMVILEMKLQLIIHEQQEVIMQMESILNYIKLLLRFFWLFVSILKVKFLEIQLIEQWRN